MRSTSFFSGARRKLKANEEQRYKDFYARTFNTKNIDEILEQGGGADFQTFKQESKGKIQIDLWNAMFNRPIKQKRTTSTLGQATFIRFFENGQITINKSERTIVRTGEKIDFLFLKMFLSLAIVYYNIFWFI